jgi:hypothetical protein
MQVNMKSFLKNFLENTDKKFWLKIGALASISILGWVLFIISLNGDSKNGNAVPDQNASSQVTNFQECIDAGNPVMESFPEQCMTPEGQSFTRDVSR